MPATKTYQGYTYEQQADGSWVRQSTPAAPVFYRDPSADAKERRANEDQEFQRQQLEIANANAARGERAQKLAEEKAAREQIEWDATHFPDGRPRPKGIPQSPQRGAQIKSILENIQRLRALSDESRAVGTDWKWTFDIPVVGGALQQNRANVEGALATVQGDLIQQQLALLSSANGGNGVASVANSEKEAERMAASIANLSPDQERGEFLKGLQRAEEYYLRQAAMIEGGEEVTDDIKRAYLPEGNPARPPEPKAAGFGATQSSIPIPPEMQAKHAAYLQENWGKLTPEGYAQFRAGLDNEFNVGSPNLEAYRGFATRANEIAAQGGSPADVGAVPAAPVDLSAFDQFRNNLVSDPLGTGIVNALDLGGAVNALSDGRVQAASELNPKAAFLGDMVSGTTGAALGGKLVGLTGTKFAPLIGDMLYGSIDGAMSDDDAIMGALTGGTSAFIGDRLGSLVGTGIARARAPDKPLTAGQQAITQTVREAGNEADIAAALARAGELGVPMTLADASPELQSLAGSAVRFSPATAGTARSVMAQRNEGQIDRLAEAVARDLGPVENIPQLSEDLLQQAKTRAGPLYDYAYASPGAADVEIMDLMQRPSFQPALREAYKQAREEGVDPTILGFVMDDAGEVSINPDAFGGYSRATVNAERNFLQPRTIRTYGGREVVKNGPLDLVGWLRTQGGLSDSGGELANMGLTNKARGRDLDFVGREAEFGPLVNPDGGMDFDTAALYAWEAGYFPELTERPDINTFLNAMRDTQDGVRQRFKVDDFPEVEAYRAARDGNNSIRTANGEMGGLWDDVSQPAGMREGAPLSAYGSEQMVGLDWQGLDWVKRGLDSIIEKETDAVTGKVSQYGRSVLDTKNTLLSRMDAINPDYAAARAAYAGPMQERAFLQRGVDAFNTRPDELAVELANLTPEQRAQMQLGFQSEIMGRAGNLRNNSNPWAPLNTPNAEGRMEALYEGAEDADIARLLSQRDLELQLAGSANRLIGNSATAEREIADEFFKQKGGVGGDLAMGVVETGALGGPWLTVGKGIADRMFKERREKAAMAANRALADDLGPLLLEQTPPVAADALTQMMAEDADYRAIVEALTESGQRWGSRIGTGFGTSMADRWAY